MKCYEPYVIKKDGFKNLVRCGECLACRQRFRREWTLRILLESCEHSSSWFITLTYSNENMTRDNSLRKRDLQDFIKRLRRNSATPLKYFAAGEYGEKTKRPHYHAVIFEDGDANDFQFNVQKAWGKYEKKTRLRDLGFTQVAMLTPARAAYCAGYTQKKLGKESKNASFVPWLEPEFTLKSKGIGFSGAIRIGKRLSGFGINNAEAYRPQDRTKNVQVVKVGKQFYPLARTMRDRVISQMNGDERTEMSRKIVNDLRTERLDREMANPDSKVYAQEIAERKSSKEKAERNRRRQAYTI